MPLGCEGAVNARPSILYWNSDGFSYRVTAIPGIVFGMSETSVATKVRRRVLASRERFWRPEDFEGTSEAVTKALSRLVASGDIRRVRRGLYWRGATSRLGMAPPPVDRLADELVGMPGSGPAGWSAALALGLSTQVPRYDTIAVPSRAPSNPRSVHLVSRAASTRRRDERLRPSEVAVLEVFRDWDALVEIPKTDAIERLKNFAETGMIRVDRLVRASASEPPRVREQLRHFLGAIGRADDAEAVRPARSESLRHDVLMAASA